MDWNGASSTGLTIIGFCVAVLIIAYVCTRLIYGSRRGGHVESDSENNSRSIGRTLNGLEPTLVASFPVINYHAPTPALSSRKCAICLEDFQQGEPLRVLPWCTHHFHLECIDVWLRRSASCPICRMNLRELSDGTARLEPSPNLRFATPDVLSARSSVSSVQNNTTSVNATTTTTTNNNNNAAGETPVVQEFRSVRRSRRWSLRYFTTRRTSNTAEGQDALTINISIDVGSGRDSSGPSTF